MNIYQRMFRMDMEMFKIRLHLNELYEHFYKKRKDIKIDNEKDWINFQNIKDKYIENAWDVEALQDNKKK